MMETKGLVEEGLAVTTDQTGLNVVVRIKRL